MPQIALDTLFTLRIEGFANSFVLYSKTPFC